MNRKIFDFLGQYICKLKDIKKEVKIPGGIMNYHPFSSSILLKDREEGIMELIDGSLYRKIIKKSQPISGIMQIRMGDPKKGGSVGSSHFTLPHELNSSLWEKYFDDSATDAFWDSAKDLQRRNSNSLGEKNTRDQYLFFSEEKPVKYFQNGTNFLMALGELEENLRKISRDFKKSWMEGISIATESSKTERYFINSEGSEVFTHDINYHFFFSFLAKTKNNLILPHGFSYSDKINPSYEFLKEAAEKSVSELEEILKSPLQKNGEFPVIFCGQNTGVLFHEVVGHSLEGQRLQDTEDEEINVFKGKLGRKIAPSFINLYSDPTLEKFNGVNLGGYYIYDEEGVKPKRVSMIKNGILKEFLHSRQSAGYSKINSNGHARSSDENMNEPCARMGNIIVESSSPVSFEDLEKMLIEECKIQKKPYGLFLEESLGGLTLPEESFYNSYPKNVFRIYQDGKKERVRGIYVVGTPYQTLSNIVAMDNNYKIFNGFCGAESGDIPQAEIAPSSFIKSLEINQIPKSAYIKVKNSIFEK